MKVIMPVWCINEQILNLTDLAIQSLGDVELIIIDNASTLGGGQLREWADVYIRNKENLGYAKAVNQGLKLCTDDECNREIVAVSNNDIRVSPNWQEVALEILRDIQVGSVHFRMIPYDQPFNSGNETWKQGKERWCTSSFFVVKPAHLYDENFINSYDDWDFWKRMRDKAFTQAYTNKAEYQHFDSFTQQFVVNRNENDQRNREYFKSKHGGYPEDLFAKEFPDQVNQIYRPMP